MPRSWPAKRAPGAGPALKHLYSPGKRGMHGQTAGRCAPPRRRPAEPPAGIWAEGVRIGRVPRPGAALPRAAGRGGKQKTGASPALRGWMRRSAFFHPSFLIPKTALSRPARHLGLFTTITCTLHPFLSAKWGGRLAGPKRPCRRDYPIISSKAQKGAGGCRAANRFFCGFWLPPPVFCRPSAAFCLPAFSHASPFVCQLFGLPAFWYANPFVYRPIGLPAFLVYRSFNVQNTARLPQESRISASGAANSLLTPRGQSGVRVALASGYRPPVMVTPPAGPSRGSSEK